MTRSQVTASYICEENRGLLLNSSYLGCIFKQHGEWVARSELYCSDDVKSSLVATIAQPGDASRRLGQLNRPDLIRIDLFLLNPNEKAVVENNDASAGATTAATATEMNHDASLHRVRLFSGRMEASLAFSNGNIASATPTSTSLDSSSNPLSATKALRSSFGHDAAVSITEYILEIPLFVASPNKVKIPPQELPSLQGGNSPSRITQRSIAPSVTMDADRIAPESSGPIKKIKVGKAFVRLEVAQESCLGQCVDRRSSSITVDQLNGNMHDDDNSGINGAAVHGPASGFVLSTLEDANMFPDSDSIYKSNDIFIQIATMGISSTIEALGTCASIVSVMQNETSSLVNNDVIQALSRIFRLVEQFLYRLVSNLKECSDDVAFTVMVNKLDELGVGALLWEYFQVCLFDFCLFDFLFD